MRWSVARLAGAATRLPQLPSPTPSVAGAPGARNSCTSAGPTIKSDCQDSFIRGKPRSESGVGPHAPPWLLTASRRHTGRANPERSPQMVSDLFSRTGVPGVKHTVAVASGKGGVGKSTVAVNLAVAMAQATGLKIGLVDADVYGPSIPTMMNLVGEQEPAVNEAGQMIPLENYGVRCMSMGFLMKADAAAVWRGPMAMKALDKIVFGTAWGGLDVLVVDMPPGTGDVQITVAQRCKLSGAVVVSTPQEVALADARRGITMFLQANVPVLGMVENMAYFRCGGCGEEHHIFGREGTAGVSKEMDVEIIGRVPLEESTRQHADEGTPVVVSSPHIESSRAFREISRVVLSALGLPSGAPAHTGQRSQ